MENKETLDKGKQTTTQTRNQQTGAGATAGQTSAGAQTYGAQGAGSATQQSRYPGSTENVTRDVNEEWNEIKERGAQMADQAKQAFNDAYERTSRSLQDSYEHAMD